MPPACAPSHNDAHFMTPNQYHVRLRTPRVTSKRLKRETRIRRVHWIDSSPRHFFQKHVFVSVGLLIFPMAWILTLHWTMLLRMDTKYSTSYQNGHLNNTLTQSPFLPFKEAKFQLRFAQRSEPVGMQSFDSFLYPVIPSSIYHPKSSNPLQVYYIGSFTNTTDFVLDALERSSYVKVSVTYVYSKITHMLKKEQRQKFDPAAPAAVIVDWTALTRDCHLLLRILSHLHRHNFLQGNDNTYLLLLDATANTRVETCSETLVEIFPVERIRLAKRSIVQGRRWNYTKLWVEPGTLIPNIQLEHGENPIIYWSGNVPEAYVDQIRVALSGVSEESNHRVVDVSHFWKASTVHQSHHYYYNRLRHIVSSQLNKTLILSKSREINLWHLTEHVGIDELVEFANDNNEDEKDEDIKVNVSWSSLHATLLASSKIVVVAQADEWEDHDDRLMEALASGAMVLCDTAIAIPKGLKHKTNIVFYDNLTDIDRYLRYYLDPVNSKKRKTIARHGLNSLWDAIVRGTSLRHFCSAKP